jgi:hypothetical protein
MKKKRLRNLLQILLAFTLVIISLQEYPGKAANYWAKGNLVGLCAGTKIHQGPGDSYPVHTIVPENNWTVKVIDGPRSANGQTWWDTSRKDAGDPSGGTGWVSQSDADRCFNPPSTPPPSTPPPPTPTPPPPPTFTCASLAVPPFETSLRLSQTYPAQFISIYYEYYTALEGHSYCPDLVNFIVNPADKNLSIQWNGNEIHLNSHLELEGYTAHLSSGPSIAAGLNEYHLPWIGNEKHFSADWLNQAVHILTLESKQQNRYGIEINPQALQQSLVYKILLATITYVAFSEVLPGAGIDPGAIPDMLRSAWTGIYNFLQIVPAYIPLAPLPAGSDLPTPSSAQRLENIDPLLNEALRQSYGPLIDSAVVRGMSVNQTASLNGSNYTLSGGVYTQDTLPAINFQANGFAPGQPVLIVIDSGGDLRTTISMNATSGGLISGSYVLSSEEASQPGSYTIAAMEESNINQVFHSIDADPTATIQVQMAAAKVTVNPVPRLVGSVSLSPTPILAGRPTTAGFTVRNDGDVPLTLQRLLLAARGPDCPD